MAFLVMTKQVQTYILMVLMAIFFISPPLSRSEFYKYTDEQGNVHYVDEEAKIPDEVFESREIYKEKYDHLPLKQRRIKEEEDRKKEKALEKKAREAYLRIIEEKKREREKREALLKKKKKTARETPVHVLGNSVLAPVTLYCNGKKVQTELVFDTGAEIISLHSDIAAQLGIQTKKRIKVQVAGGKIVDAHLATLSAVELGPKKVENIQAVIFDFTGTGYHSGLLGMNFLKHFQYSLDMNEQVIRWQD